VEQLEDDVTVDETIVRGAVKWFDPVRGLASSFLTAPMMGATFWCILPS
jgi:hypothetical protein